MKDKLESNENLINAMKTKLARAEETNKSIEEQFEVSKKRKEQYEIRYSEVAEDYEKLADEKEILQKKFEKLSDEKAITSEVLNSVQKDNTKMKEEIIRLSAPKFATPKSQKPRRTQFADANPHTPRSASSAASSAGSRASSEDPRSQRKSGSAKMILNSIEINEHQ